MVSPVSFTPGISSPHKVDWLVLWPACLRSNQGIVPVCILWCIFVFPETLPPEKRSLSINYRAGLTCLIEVVVCWKGKHRQMPRKSLAMGSATDFATGLRPGLDCPMRKV